MHSVEKEVIVTSDDPDVMEEIWREVTQAMRQTVAIVKETYVFYLYLVASYMVVNEQLIFIKHRKKIKIDIPLQETYYLFQFSNSSKVMCIFLMLWI